MKKRKKIKLKNVENNHVVTRKKTNKFEKSKSYKNAGVKFKENKIKKNNIGAVDKKVLYTVILLICVGIIMIFSSSGYYSLKTEGDAYYFIRKTIQYLPLGIIGMLIGINIDYHIYKRWVNYIYIGTIIVLIIVLFQPDMNGATRWIYIGSFSFQPSEFAKYAIVLCLAAKLEERRKYNGSFVYGTLYYIGMAGIISLLIERENNLSIATIILIVTFMLIYLGGVKLWNLILLIIPAIPLGIYLIKSEGYRMLRVTGFLDPWNDPSGNSYQLIQSLYAISSGGITGRGIGQSIFKNLYIPEPHNDFIFAIVAEELGMIGGILVILIFVQFLLFGFITSRNAPDMYGRLLAAGIVLIITVQAVINIAVATGSMPVTGVPLPFISYGGTSLVINMSAMGVLLNVSRHRKIQKNSL